MPRPRVAVIIPCFNTAAYLPDALRSACNQSYPDLEIVVVNDGSTDDFEGAIAPFRERVRIIEQDNRGLSAARNAGIAATRSEFLAFLDADDVWHRCKIERQVAFLQAHPDCCMVHTRARKIDASGAVRPWNPPPPTPGAAESGVLGLLQRNPVIVSSVLVRRADLQADRFAPEVAGADDWDLWLRLAARARFGYLDEELTDYRVHGANMSAKAALMLSAEAGVLQRAAARATRADERRLAIRRRNETVRSLAHHHYEHGDMNRARVLFLSARWSWGTDEAVRCLATLFPARARGVARRLRAWTGDGRR